jgi:hypothetical protein
VTGQLTAMAFLVPNAHWSDPGTTTYELLLRMARLCFLIGEPVRRMNRHCTVRLTAVVAVVVPEVPVTVTV